MLTSPDRERLAELSHEVRRHCVRMAGGGGCFLGASLSCADLLVHLYARVLRVTPETAQSPDRDYLLLSKGHDVPALYGTLAELGWMDRARLANHLSPDDAMYWHPNRKMPGVEFHSGSLGHLLSVGMGLAYDLKLRASPGRVFVILGDGELDEGSIWEGLLVASAYRLDNLVLVVDRNAFQANMPTEELIPLEPLAPKFRAFGCAVTTVDGHDHDQLAAGFAALPLEAGKPTVIIATTVRGKGLPSIEARADRWFVRLPEQDVTSLLAELEGTAPAAISAETLVVR